MIADEARGRHVRARRSVVSACSHAGIVNACLGAMAAFPGRPVDLGARRSTTWPGDGTPNRSTADDLFRQVNRIVAPGHCTGWRATAALAEVGFDGYSPSAVGAYYHLQEE